MQGDGKDIPKLLSQIKDIIIKTVIAGQPELAHLYRSCQPDDVENSMCFEILGFDILIDSKMKPWLIEVNHSPSFDTDTPLDYKIKHGLIKDTMKLVN
jgi:tubulin polyglutamylase TTLL6/13